jgi:hypothetical protein
MGTEATTATIAEIRRELQQLLSKEHDLVYQVEHATASCEYVRLRDLADELIQVAERRTQLRTSLIEAKARDKTDQGQASTQRKAFDQAADTWRLLR